MLRTSTERRRFRVQLAGRLQGSVSLRMDVRLINLSVDGAMIEHEEVLAPGMTFPLFLKLDNADLCLPALIVWSHVHRTRKGDAGEGAIFFRSGLEFRDLPQDVRAHLENYLLSMGSGEL